MVSFSHPPSISAIEAAFAYLSLASSLGVHVTVTAGPRGTHTKTAHFLPRGAASDALARMAAAEAAARTAGATPDLMVLAAAACDAGINIFSRQTGRLCGVEHHVPPGSDLPADQALARVAAQWFIHACKANRIKLSLDWQDGRFGLWARYAASANADNRAAGARAVAWRDSIPGAREEVIEALKRGLDPDALTIDTMPDISSRPATPFLQAAE
jgi:hypothetical protein